MGTVVSGDKHDFTGCTGEVYAIALLQKHFLPGDSSALFCPTINDNTRKALKQLAVATGVALAVMGVKNSN